MARSERPVRWSLSASACSSTSSPVGRRGVLRRRKWANTVERWIPYLERKVLLCLTSERRIGANQEAHKLVRLFIGMGFARVEAERGARENVVTDD